MKFNEQARLDTSQVQDRRGSSGGGGGGGLGGMLGGAKGVGGGLGLIVVVVFTLIQVFSSGGGGGGAGATTGGLLNQLSGGGSGTADNSQLDANCRTGADANNRDDCRAVGRYESLRTEAALGNLTGRDSAALAQARAIRRHDAVADCLASTTTRWLPLYGLGASVLVGLGAWAIDRALARREAGATV